jgi:pyruvate ferredoxin oxidoreductase delta subunit
MSEQLEKHTARSRQSKALLGPVATTFATAHTGSWRTERPEVDFDGCSGCGVCSQYCPTGVIEVRKGEEHCVFIQWYNCKGCGICANVCPKQCITMIPERGDGGD